MRPLLLLLLVLAPVASADAPARLQLSRLPGDAQLTALLWERSPDLVAARLRLQLAGAEVTRSKVWPNPGFDFLWGTFPIGPTNPPGLDRFTQVPNYTFTLNQLVELESGARAKPRRGTRARQRRSTRWSCSASAGSTSRSASPTWPPARCGQRRWRRR